MSFVDGGRGLRVQPLIVLVAFHTAFFLGVQLFLDWMGVGHGEKSFEDGDKGLQDMQTKPRVDEFKIEGDLGAGLDQVVQNLARVYVLHLQQVDDAEDDSFVQ